MSQTKIPIANPGDADYKRGLMRMWIAASPYKSHSLYVWADSFDDAFEELVEWADDHVPGAFTSIGVPELKEAAEDLGITWKDSWPDWEDRKFEKVAEHAEMDLTLIGHTTLKSGQYVPSEMWGGDEIRTGSKDYKEVLARSTRSKLVYSKKRGTVPKREERSYRRTRWGR